MTVEKLESGKRYERGMRYKLSFCNGDSVQYLTEMAFLELGRKITTLQNTSSNSEYKQGCSHLSECDLSKGKRCFTGKAECYNC